MKSGEMLAASAIVINQRVLRMMLAGPNPNARDRREFHRMGMEKLEAAAESVGAVALRSALLVPQSGLLLWQQWMNGMPGMFALGTQTPATLTGTYMKWLQAALQGGALLSAQGARNAATLAGHGLRPIHRRATANARRLSRSG